MGPRGVIVTTSAISNIFARAQSGHIWHYMCVMALFLLGFFFINIGTSDIAAISMLTTCFVGKKKQSLKKKHYFSTMPMDSQINFPPISNTPPQTAFSKFISLLGGLLVSLVFKDNGQFVEIISGILLISILVAGIYHLYYQNYYIIKNFLESFKMIDFSEKTFLSRLYIKNYFFLFFARVIVVHFFFYTTYGSLLKQLVIFFTVGVSIIYGTPKCYSLFFFIVSITSLLVSSFISLTVLFYTEKSRKIPYLYKYVDKKKVLSLVENTPGVTTGVKVLKQIWDHVGSATACATVVGTVHIVKEVLINRDNNNTQITISHARNETDLRIADKNLEASNQQLKAAMLNNQTELEKIRSKEEQSQKANKGFFK